MVQDVDAPETSTATARAQESPSGVWTRRDQAALVAFVAVELGALVFYVVIGRHMWFFHDEWAFLALRGLNLHDAFAAHGGHLVALPLVAYRVLFAVVGLRSYRPYQLLAILDHLATAALLRVVMRRAGVRPWMATLAASVFVFFGSGGRDILWGFQIAFTGALLFGLGQLLFAEHDGPIDRRDWLGIGAGLLALCCSGVGVTMVAIAGLAALIRRGWRAAAFHVVPLAAAYGVWFFRSGSHPTDWNARLIFEWDRDGLAGTFRALAHVPFLGWVLALMVVAGLAVAWIGHDVRWLRAHVSIPVATVAGAVVFVTSTGASRAFFGDGATASRYLYVVAALVLPAIAVAADALARRNRWLGIAVATLLLAGIPGNVHEANAFAGPIYHDGWYRRMIVSLPRMPLAQRVPRTLHPDPNDARQVTVGWLLDVARSGKLPVPRALTPSETATNTLRLSLDETVGSAGQCEPLTAPATFDVAPGESFSVRGTIGVRLVPPAVRATSSIVVFGANVFARFGEHLLTNVGDALSLHVVRLSPHATLCGAPSR